MWQRLCFVLTVAEICLALRFNEPVEIKLNNVDLQESMDSGLKATESKEGCMFLSACSNSDDQSLPPICVPYCSKRASTEAGANLHETKTKVSQEWCRRQAGCLSKVGGFPAGCNPWCVVSTAANHGHHGSKKHHRRRRRKNDQGTDEQGAAAAFIAKFRLKFTNGFKKSLEGDKHFETSVYAALAKFFKMDGATARARFRNLVVKEVNRMALKETTDTSNTLTGILEVTADVNGLLQSEKNDMLGTTFGAIFFTSVAEAYKLLSGVVIQFSVETLAIKDDSGGSGSGKGSGSGSATFRREVRKVVSTLALQVGKIPEGKTKKTLSEDPVFRRAVIAGLAKKLGFSSAAAADKLRIIGITFTGDLNFKSLEGADNGRALTMDVEYEAKVIASVPVVLDDSGQVDEVQTLANLLKVMTEKETVTKLAVNQDSVQSMTEVVEAVKKAYVAESAEQGATITLEALGDVKLTVKVVAAVQTTTTKAPTTTTEAPTTTEASSGG